MKRFTKEALKRTIEDCSTDIQATPKIMDIVEYVNRNLNRDDYSSREEYMKYYVGDNLVKYYVDLYNLNHLVNQPKRRKPNIIEEEKPKHEPKPYLFDMDEIQAQMVREDIHLFDI